MAVCKKITGTLFILFLIVSRSFSQDYVVSGVVSDARTRQPLAFVNIVINDSRFGGSTDIDGKFRLKSSDPVKYLQLSYVGYAPRTFYVGTRHENLVITMTEKDIDLTEVEILPGVNPAHRIIRNAIDNRELNDPEKLQSFSYTSYDKTVFIIDADTSLRNPFTDTLQAKRKSNVTLEFEPETDTTLSDSARLDSAEFFIQKLMEQQYLFLMENVTKRKFLAPDRNYNEVIATKMSGFKDPMFVFLTTQIQSFSFYKPFITIFQQNYVNPIGTGSLSKYFFKLEDTTYVGKDTIFVISFRPRHGTNFDGLKGVISISTHKWGIRSVIAQPYGEAGGISIKIQQSYDIIDSNYWFPVQLNTDISLNNFRIGKYVAIGSGRYYIRDIVLNPELVRREFNHLDVEVNKDATIRTETYWDQYRVDSLTSRDKKTYEVLDSIGKANNFDKMAKNFKTLLTGRIPWGPIEFDINKFIGYNTYEGLILGLGIHTSDKVSKTFKIGGYYQYAFAVSTSKYGGDASVVINRRHDVRVKAAYFYDLTESGGVSFPDDNESVLSGNFRPLLLKQLDRTQCANASISFRATKYLLMNAGFNWSHKKTSNYDLATYEGNAVILQDDFIFTEFGAGFKWAYGEKFIQTTDSKMSLGTKFPILWVQYTRGIKGLADGGFDYDRFDLKLRKTFNIKYLGKLTVQVSAGYVDQPIPACNLFNGNGSYRLITLFAPYSFATMRMNEFLNSGYGALYLYHDFEQLLFKGKKWFHPEFAIAQNIGFGFLADKSRYAYYNEDLKEMNLGYYESGLLINNIVNLKLYKVGIGAFYRWGPYSFDNVGDNFAYKISLIFPLNAFTN
jgi:hypothetical protein